MQNLPPQKESFRLKLSPTRKLKDNNATANNYYSKTAENSSKKYDGLQYQQQKFHNQEKFGSKIYIWGNLTICNLTSNHENLNRSPLIQRINQSTQANGNQDLPKQLCKFKNSAIVNVQCGKNHAAFLTKKGELFMIGSNDQGQLGNGEKSQEPSLEPILLSSLFYKGLQVENVACGFSHTLATLTSGKVYAWGYGKFGAIGLGNFECRNSPNEISFFTNKYQSAEDIAVIQCGAHHSALLDKKGNLYMWGAGEVGQLGTGSRINECTPQITRKGFLENEQVKQIALGYFHTLILTSTGRVLETGVSSRQLMVESTNSTQTILSELPTLKNHEVVQIKAKEFSAAVNTQGQLLIWQSPDLLEIVNDSSRLVVDDFELCKDFILIRNRDKFLKFLFEERKLKAFESNSSLVKINDLSILSCGHSYILGTKTKKRRDGSRKSGRKSEKGLIQSGEKALTSSAKKLLQKEVIDVQSQQQLRDQEYLQSLHDGTSTQSTEIQPINFSQVRRLSSSRMTRVGSRGEILYSNQTHVDAQNSSKFIDELKPPLGVNTQKDLDFSSSHQQSFEITIKDYQNINNPDTIKGNLSKTKSQHQSIGILRQENQHNPQSSNIFNNSQAQSRICFNDQSNYTGGDSPIKSFLYQKISIHQTAQDNIQSLRISYDEANLKDSDDFYAQQRDNLDSQRSLNPLSESNELPPSSNHKLRSNKRSQYQHEESTKHHQSSEFVGHNSSSQTRSAALSEKKKTQKDKMKEALKKEIRMRLQLEHEMLLLQQQFESFKKEVGVDQMKSVLAESQEEYQKLYEMCVAECEKSSRLNELYKREKKAREDRENQIVELGEEQTLLKNQIRYLEEQLNLMRDDKEKDQDLIKQTVLDQQKIIEGLKEQHQEEKAHINERIFDLEENLQRIHEEQSTKEDGFKNLVMIEKQSNQILTCQNEDLKLIIENQNEHIKVLTAQVTAQTKIECENENLKQQITSLQQTIHQKNQNLQSIDQIIANFSEKELEYLRTIEAMKLQLAQNQQSVQTTTQNNQPYNQQQILTQPQHIQSKSTLSNSRINSTGRLSTNSNSISSTSHLKRSTQGAVTSTGNLVQNTRADNLQNPKIISQTVVQQKIQGSLNSSLYSTRKSLTGQSSQSINREKGNQMQPSSSNKTLNHSQGNITLIDAGFKKTSQKQSSRENSPEKLQHMIEQQDQNTKRFLTDITKIVGSSGSSTSGHEVNEFSLNSVPSQASVGNTSQSMSQVNNSLPGIKPHQQLKSSQSNLDYLGLKPKSPNHYAPRLSSSNGSQSHRSLNNSNKQAQQLKSRNTTPQLKGNLTTDSSIKDLNKSSDELNTPSQCILKVTPQILSTTQPNQQQLQQNEQQVIVTNENASVNNKSMFDQDFDNEHHNDSSMNESSQMKKKQVKFMIDSQKSSIQHQTSFQEQLQQDHHNQNHHPINLTINHTQMNQISNYSSINHPGALNNLNESNLSQLKDGTVSQTQMQEDEIDKLYESLNTEMKGLKGGNVENLKEKLEAIRKNKAVLEARIKDYEKKLGK